MGTTVVNGVTYINSTGAVKFSDMAACYGNGTNRLSLMRGKKWYRSDFTRGNFPSSGTISLSSLRGTGGSLPRVDRNLYPANGKFIQSGNITLPKFNTIMFTVYGGSGGGGGYNGVDAAYLNIGGKWQWVYTTANGGAGGSGGQTAIVYGSNTATAPGGGGGNQGTAGTNGTAWNSTDVLAGGAGNGNGGKGGSTRTATINADTAYSSAAALWDTICYVAYGGAGSAGAGAGNYQAGANGNPGIAGAVSMFIDYGLY